MARRLPPLVPPLVLTFHDVELRVVRTGRALRVEVLLKPALTQTKRKHVTLESVSRALSELAKRVDVQYACWSPEHETAGALHTLHTMNFVLVAARAAPANVGDLKLAAPLLWFDSDDTKDAKHSKDLDSRKNDQILFGRARIDDVDVPLLVEARSVRPVAPEEEMRAMRLLGPHIPHQAVVTDSFTSARACPFALQWQS